jgi:hypothetical protein
VIAAVQQNTVQVWEVATGYLILEYERSNVFLATVFTGDGNVLALAAHVKGGWFYDEAELWDVFAGKRLGQFRVPGQPFTDLALSESGAILAAAQADKTALTWSLRGLGEATRPEKLDTRDLETLWRQLAEADAGRAYQAVRKLSRAPTAAIPLLRGRLQPATPGKVPALIADLDAKRFVTRQAAAKELARLGMSAESALQAALRTNVSLEVRRRIEGLLENLEAVPLPAEEVRSLRAVQVLEMVGTPDAVQVLKRLARGAADALLTREAQASVQRLARKPAATN